MRYPNFSSFTRNANNKIIVLRYWSSPSTFGEEALWQRVMGGGLTPTAIYKDANFSELVHV